jgi:hypothetical protein
LGKFIRYPEERALEDVAFGRGGTPTRLCRMLLPVWHADVRATIYDSEPYELIDRYIDAAVARGGLETVPELAGFFGLDEVVVDRAVRFLVAIGHLSQDPVTGRLAVEDLGRMSVQEGKRYRRELEDRRKLYFDGFKSRPLTRPYYDERAVTFVDAAGLQAAMAEHDGPGFTPVQPIPVTAFDPSALSSLETMPDRDRFNLPAQVIAPSLVGPPSQVFLPAYVVRAQLASRVEYLAYTQASNEVDAEWSRVCSEVAEIAGVVENEDLAGAASRENGREEDAARNWVSRRFSGRFDLTRWDGLLLATLPASAFTGSGESGESGVPLSKLGSFAMMNTWFFRLWCDDVPLRRRALLERVDSYLGARTRMDPADVTGRLERFGWQLGFDQMTLGQLRELARKAGKHALAAQLDTLIHAG